MDKQYDKQKKDLKEKVEKLSEIWNSKDHKELLKFLENKNLNKKSSK